MSDNSIGFRRVMLTVALVAIVGLAGCSTGDTGGTATPEATTTEAPGAGMQETPTESQDTPTEGDGESDEMTESSNLRVNTQANGSAYLFTEGERYSYLKNNSEVYFWDVADVKPTQGSEVEAHPEGTQKVIADAVLNGEDGTVPVSVQAFRYPGDNNDGPLFAEAANHPTSAEFHDLRMPVAAAGVSEAPDLSETGNRSLIGESWFATPEQLPVDASTVEWPRKQFTVVGTGTVNGIDCYNVEMGTASPDGIDDTYCVNQDYAFALQNSEENRETGEETTITLTGYEEGN